MAAINGCRAIATCSLESVSPRPVRHTQHYACLKFGAEGGRQEDKDKEEALANVRLARIGIGDDVRDETL